MKNQCLGGIDSRTCVAHWPANLIKSMNSRFNERLCQNKQDGKWLRNKPDCNLCPPHTHEPICCTHTSTYTENRQGIVLKLKVITNLWECLEMSATTEDRVLDGPSWSRDRNLESTANSECLVLFRIFCPEPSFWTLGALELLVCQCIGLLEKLWTLEIFQKTHGHQHISSSVSLLQLIDYVNFSFLMWWRKGKVDYLVIMPVDAITNEPQYLTENDLLSYVIIEATCCWWAVFHAEPWKSGLFMSPSCHP